MVYLDEKENKLAFRDWKVFIDNSSEWFDTINKKLSKCYIDINLLKFVYPEVRSFTSSRKANLYNFKLIDEKLTQVKKVLYSSKYNELKQNKSSSEWDEKLLNVMDSIIQLLSEGLSDGELTPKVTDRKEIPYELEGNVNDLINKSTTKTNNTSKNKDGKLTSN